MKKTLLIIDIQESYMEKYSPLLISCINKRIKEAIDNNEIVVYIKNTKNLRSGKMINDFDQKLFICSGHIICKEKASAFSNSKLQEILTEKQISEIEIAGIDGNSCVKSTAFDAVSIGYKTTLNTDCIGVKNINRFEITKEILLKKGILIR